MCEAFEMRSFCMGTVIDQRVYGKNAEKAVEKVDRELKRLEALLSFFLSSSEVSKLNSFAGISGVELSSETIYILKKAKYFSEMCNGAFDVTIAPLVKKWGIFTEKQRVPSRIEIDNSLSLIGYKEVLIDDNSKIVKLSREGQMVDLGAIAKGYAADRSKEIYMEYGIESAFINIGGNVLVHGNKPDRSLWKVGLQNPIEIRGKYVAVVMVSDKTVVTSGDYERNFKKGNVKYHHILDPRTGYPANSGLMSTTIITKNSIDADALSTAIFVQGLEEGMELINRIEEVEGIFITKEKEIYITKGLKDDFIFTSEDNEFSCFAI